MKKTVVKSRDVRVSRLARELGISEAEAKEMRRQVEFIEISAVQRYVFAGRIEIERRRG